MIIVVTPNGRRRAATSQNFNQLSYWLLQTPLLLPPPPPPPPFYFILYGIKYNFIKIKIWQPQMEEEEQTQVVSSDT